MTRGIKIDWFDEDGRLIEIEYFCEVDVNDLQDIPSFNSVRAVWPSDGGISVEYSIDVRCQWLGGGRVHLIVDYDEANNRKLVDDHGLDCDWGTTTIVLEQGQPEGHCEWLAQGSKRPEGARWKTFDLEQSHGRPLSKYWRSRRHSQFRKMILECDRYRCVLTKETTQAALEAAHLVPARDGENDMPFNGIALRSDIHGLFDAGLFTFDEKGKVQFSSQCSCLSDEYRQLLRNKRLPKPTLNRVRTTLALAQFRER